jgi:hypothetical protein
VAIHELNARKLAAAVIEHENGLQRLRLREPDLSETEQGEQMANEAVSP